MKKFLLPSLFAIGFFANAQVDVTASAGTATASYTTLKGAFDAINLGTHQGNIKLSISGNTTETASASLSAIGGAVSYTSILIKPTVAATISGTVSAAALVNLNGATNVTIDGSIIENGTTKDLTFSNTNTGTTSSVLRFINGASNNNVKNIILRGVSTGTTNGVLVFSTSTAAAGNNNNTVTNSEITKGTTNPAVLVYNSGTTAKANTNNVVSNSKIYDFTTYGVFDGGNSDGFSILNNDIYLSAAVASTALTGIRPNTGTVVSSIYRGNKIHDIVTTTAAGAVTGINLYTISATSSILVANNMLYNLSGPTAGSGTIIGIYDQLDPGSVANIYYNTVLISGAVTGTTGSYAYYRAYQNPTVLKNNIFANTRTSSGGYIQAAFRNSNSVGTFTSDYNVLYNSGGSANISAIDLVGTTATQYATFSAYQAAATNATPARDVNSKGVEPVFVSATDLHLSTTDFKNENLSNWATPIAAVTTDFDGDTRSAATPDVGADEFTYVPSTPAPNCTTITSPSASATGVTINPTTITWSVAPNASAYKLYVGTATGSYNLVNGTVTTSTSYTSNLAANSTYYVKVVPYNATGEATGCSELTFTTGSYCSAAGTVDGNTGLGITKVEFSNLSNTSVRAAFQDFTAVAPASVEASRSYNISITNANSTGYYTGDVAYVWIDYNNDGTFDDSTERTAVTVNGITSTGAIVIPATATLGTTRMRVRYSNAGANANTACGTATYGEVEDYSVEIKQYLAVSDVNKAGISVYPNPFTDVLKISDVKGVKSISVNDISGREVKSLAPSAELNLSSLKTGLYIVNLTMEDGSVKTFKAIKK
ncbi:GEVED domain-containing protein [Chryseobacterium sp. KACC 21268]|nr:GEVED domain-containing protein [Chryseobacterium sp. KACC 21268]